MFSRYFQGELVYLRELGRAFGAAHPSLAALLAERSGDPDVERLLEGVAFLTARIRERMDDALPELVHGLAELVVPQYLRTLPASSIVEFTPQARLLRGRARIPAGSALASRTVDGTSCLFRTTADLEVLPLVLQETVLEDPGSAAPVLRLRFQLGEQGAPEVFRPAGVRLYVHAEPALAATLMLWLLRKCRAVHVRGPAGPGVRLGPEVVRPLGTSPSFPLFPWPSHAPEGLRGVLEYFTLPQKLLFFEVGGLEAAAGVVAEGTFELAFELDRPPALPARPPRDVFRLNCAPVVNLFSIAAEPVRHTGLEEEHLLRAAGMEPSHMEVYSVDSVVGLRAGRADRIRYRPFSEFAHAVEGAEVPAFYRVRRSLSPVDGGVDVHLSLGTPRDVAPELRSETLSIGLTCTNRALPAQLQVGDVCVATPTSPTFARFRNLVPATRPVRPPLGAELQWRLLAHLKVGHRSLLDAEALRGLLGLYNFQASSDEPAAQVNQRRIDAIRAVQGAAVTRLLQGAPVRGVRTLVELAEAGFAAPGEAFLFGMVLDELLASSVSLNSFNELGIRLQPSQAELTWPARCGFHPIL